MTRGACCSRKGKRTKEENTEEETLEHGVYAIYDPMQKLKPADRTKDIISHKYRNRPCQLDTVSHKGCDTIWKCFKRTVWVQPDLPFLGYRKPIQNNLEQQFGLASQMQDLGEYQWQTWKETDDIVEALANAIIKKKLCKLTKSDVEGTPDLKMMGIFSENRP